jgi:hypothetical protein
VNGRAGADVPGVVGDLADALGPVVAAPGKDLDGFVHQMNLDTVELDRVNPALAGRHVLGRGRQGRRDESGVGRLPANRRTSLRWKRWRAACPSAAASTAGRSPHQETRKYAKRSPAGSSRRPHAGAAGVNRTLDISDFTDETRQAIERMIERSEKWALEGTIDRHRSEVARLLAKICYRIFPKRSIQYSLFSLRDQWVANMSAVKTKPAELSALLGRMKVKTDAEHYRNRRRAWETDDINEIPKALECQVIRYRRMWAMYEDRRMYHKG